MLRRSAPQPGGGEPRVLLCDIRPERPESAVNLLGRDSGTPRGRVFPPPHSPRGGAHFWRGRAARCALRQYCTVMKDGANNGKGKWSDRAHRRPSYPGEQWVKRANTSTKTWVKVAMAIVYFLSVSVVACILVIYYVIFWTPNTTNNSTTSSSPTRNTSCSP
ncbi:hypothetical protein Z043_112120 [Scleropages formosus]|uniref:Transmembrane protein INAFM2 n=1 Tax=Scleropages formosus TaxID=113540 RepID=A0A0P7UH61_SCLFO|nr:hypothetical protein Z043_112120 [Scleropages formosus]